MHIIFKYLQGVGHQLEKLNFQNFHNSCAMPLCRYVVPLPAIWFTASAGAGLGPGMEVALEETKRLIHDGHAAILKAALP
jgi:hypothetical protein